MEIRARYIQVGAFTLAVLAAGFAFVYWLNNAGALRGRMAYQVRFESPVSGLLRGSAVLFNGIRVGEVTALELSSTNPRQVRATIAVERSTPIRADTSVGIDFQGLTGSPVIALVAGSSNLPLAAPNGAIPLLVADPSAGQSMSQTARDVLRRMDGVLAENAQPLRSVISNLDTFSGALARNSDRLDGIVAGLERMTGGAASRARVVVYDLRVPKSSVASEKSLPVQLIVPDPTALSALDTEKIQSTSPSGANTPLADTQWGDTLPRLLQMKIIRSFDDANAFAGVNRPLEGLVGDFQLLIDVRKFQIAVFPKPTAEVEFAAKIVDNKGRIAATRIFSAAAPAATESAAAVTALDAAFGRAAADLVPWAVRIVSEHYAKSESPKKAPRG